MKICTVPDCGKPHKGRGLCAAHWFRLKSTGNATTPYKRIPSYKGVKCAVDGRDTQARKNDKCTTHDAQDRRTPEWLAARRATDLSRQEKLMGRPCPDRCESCGDTPDESKCNRWGKLYFDHDHKTAKPRGWLCGPCNLTLGQLQDSAVKLLALATYLEEHS